MRYLLTILLLGGCAYWQEPEVLSQTTDQITFKAGARSNPGPLAMAHCGSMGKQAVLVSAGGTTPFNAYTLIYEYRCE